MTPKKHSNKASRRCQKLQFEKTGDLYVEFPDEPGEARLRISFKRNWYSPPFTEDGKVDLERAQEELSEEFTGGTLVLATYLESGELGYRTEIPVASKDELEQFLRSIRKLFVDGVKHENTVRRAALDACISKIAEAEVQSREARPSFVERRRAADRRMGQRRGRQLLGRLFFRKDDRRMEDDRRDGKDRRAA